MNKFYCADCHYSTCNNYDYNKHLSTRKHKNKIIINDFSSNIANIAGVTKKYNCQYCEKKYIEPSGLWRHRKICVGEKNMKEDTNIIDKNMFMEMMKQNKEIQNLLLEQNAKLMDELKTVKNIQNNFSNTNTNSNNNNSFNLNFFLNEQCKHAVNLVDFIDSLKVTVTDLEKTGKLGYVEGLSSIFLNGLRELDVYSRPIHCTDLKRETVYVKDHDKWEKENEEKPRLKHAVKRIATKNLKQLPFWEKENPEFSNFTSKESEKYLIISKNSLGGFDKEEDTKYQDSIIRNVLKEIKIPVRN